MIYEFFIYKAKTMKKLKRTEHIWIKPWLKNRNDRSVHINTFSEFLLTDKFQHYLPVNTTLLWLFVAGGYTAFFQIFHPQNNFIMTLPFYQNVKLGPTPAFYYQPPPPRSSPAHPPLLAPPTTKEKKIGFFDFTENKKLLRQDRTLFKNKK